MTKLRSKLRDLLGAVLIVSGFSTVYVAGQIADSFGGAAAPTAAGALAVVAGGYVLGILPPRS